MIIVSDFSKTFTKSSMPTTWSVFAKSGTLGQEYIDDRNALYEEYFQFEQAGNVEKTEEWFLKHAELFVKYQLTQEQIDTVVMDDLYFAPRDGVRDFIDAIVERDIALYIVSSGISQIIARWFELRFDFVPDIIVANELIFDNGVTVGVDNESIICPLDKVLEFGFEYGEQDMILMGDAVEDTQVIKKPAKTIGFTDEGGVFDIKLGREARMDEVLQYL